VDVHAGTGRYLLTAQHANDHVENYSASGFLN